jgi:ribosomal protein S18 acetylase RimI-like enzyme
LTFPDPTFRPLTDASELELFATLEGPSYGPPDRDFLATATQRHYRPEWTWIAQRGDRIVARAAWWGGPDEDHPYALDWFDLGTDDDRVTVGAELLRQAHGKISTAEGRAPDYHLFLPPDWRDVPEVRAAAQERIDAATEAGMQLFVERLRIEWRSSAGVPVSPDPGRLRFDPVVEGDDGPLLELLERLNEGTLDAHARRDLDQHGVAQAARIQLDDLRWMPVPPDHWRVATLASDGSVVGVVMPSRNYEFWVIGYLGVVPEHRGHGYIDDLLAEGTALLAAQGAEVIKADTDTGNVPMAAAFTRAGYEVTARRIMMSLQPPDDGT